ncbi:MAG: PDZ domain-containing protein [bacterium]
MKTRVLLLVLAALLVAWGLFGLLDLRNIPWGGFDHFHSVVVEVNEGGPADRAGLRVGDRLLSLGGISLGDRDWPRRPQPEIGDTRLLVVERTDESSGVTTTENIEVTYSQEPTTASALSSVNWVIGLAFLLCGMLVYLKAPGTPSLLFSIAGLCFGGFLLPRPLIGSFDLRVLAGSIFFVALCIGCACFLHLLLIFPKRKRVMEKKKAGQLIYLPLAALALVGIIHSVWGPLGGAVRTIGAVLVAIVLLGYLVLSMVALIHSYVKAAPHERAEEGLNTLLAGVLLGLLPITSMAVSGIFFSIGPLPGSRFYFLPLVLIPISFAWALLKGARGSRL